MLGMRTSWAVPVIASILILGTLGLIQEANAVTFTATQNGNWNDAATWGGAGPPITITSADTVTIPSGITVIIPDSVRIVNFGTINNFGIINNNFNGVIFNIDGPINNFGTISNLQGTIFNVGTIDNSGIIFTPNIILGNNGLCFFNGFNIQCGSRTNIIFGILMADRNTIINSGTIDNGIKFVGSTIVGGGQVSCGAGTTLNESTNECEPDVTQTQLDAALAQRDAALADLTNLFTNNSCFPLAVTIQAILDCIINFNTDLATAQADLLTAQNTITELLIILDGTVISSDFDGNLEVRPSDTLTIKSGATIDGNIVVNGGKLTIKEGSTITGNVDSKNSQGVTIQNSNINGNVEVKDGDLNILAGAVIDGNVKVEGGTCTISVDATVNGNLEGDCAP